MAEYLKYIELVGGLALLIASGDYLVKGGVAIARRLHISSLVVGMTVVAFGTSAPELLVSLQAAVGGNPEIAVGNVVGSNIANIGLILGITALLLPIPVNGNSLRFDGPVLLGASLLFCWAAANGTIGRSEGILGFALLIGFVIWSIRKSRQEGTAMPASEETDSVPETALWKAALFIVASAVGLTYGARLLVSSASAIAFSLGVSERVIGVTIVAFGTSVPELAASVTAALRKEMDISIGNIIGSNIFNILCVIGVSAAVKPISVDFGKFGSDFGWMLLFTVLLLAFMLPWKRMVRRKNERDSAGWTGGIIGRLSGAMLLSLYLVYIYRLF